MNLNLTQPLQFHNRNYEECILSHVLQNVEVDTITTECPTWYIHQDFIRNVYQISHEYLTGIGRGVVDYNSVLDILAKQQRGTPEIVQYLNRFRTIDVASYPKLDYVLENLKGLALRRRFITRMERQLANAKNINVEIDKVLMETEDELLTIEGDHSKIEIIHGEAIKDRRYEGLMARRYSRGIYTGWPIFDEKLSVGMAPGKTSVVAGRTSMGKSFFKTNVIISQAQQGIGILNICPEQGFDSEHDRIDAVLSGVHLNSISRIREWPANSEKFGLLKDSTMRTAGWNYACVPTRNITVAGVQSSIRRMKRMGMPVDVVYIDLFDRLQDVNVVRDRVGTISVKLNQIERIAEEEQVHICLLVQINRAPESRKDKRPTLGDLRDCGNFEQDADMVFLLYREGYYDDTIEDNVLDVTIAKQRDGVRGVTIQFAIMDKQTLAILPVGERKHSVEA